MHISRNGIKYKIVIFLYVFLVFLHLVLRTRGLLAFPLGRFMQFGINIIPFKDFAPFLIQQGAFKIAGKIAYYFIYALPIAEYVRPFLDRNRLFIAYSLFTILLEEMLNLLFSGQYSVIFDMNNIMLYLVGLAIGYGTFQAVIFVSAKIKVKNKR